MPTKRRVVGSPPRSPIPDRPRTGRPPKAESGQVEERILETATALFMEKGYEGVSFEQIASMAHAGKATIYARHANKEALFFAVIRRSIESSLAPARYKSDVTTPHDLLSDILLVLLDRMTTVETVSLTRLVIGELLRFPSLARLVDEFGRQQAIDIVWRSLKSDQKFNAPSAGAKRAPPEKARARLFLDQLFAPLMLRALLGEDLNALRSEIPQRVLDAVERFRELPSSSRAHLFKTSRLATRLP